MGNLRVVSGYCEPVIQALFCGRANFNDNILEPNEHFQFGDFLVTNQACKLTDSN